MQSRIESSPPNRLCFRIQVNPDIASRVHKLTKRYQNSLSLQGIADRFRSLSALPVLIHRRQVRDDQRRMTEHCRRELYHLHGDQIESCPYIRRLIPQADLDKLQDIQAMFDAGYVPETIDAIVMAFDTRMALTILRAFTTTTDEAS